MKKSIFLKGLFAAIALNTLVTFGGCRQPGGPDVPGSGSGNGNGNRPPVENPLYRATAQRVRQIGFDCAQNHPQRHWDEALARAVAFSPAHFTAVGEFTRDCLADSMAREFPNKNIWARGTWGFERGSHMLNFINFDNISVSTMAPDAGASVIYTSGLNHMTDTEYVANLRLDRIDTRASRPAPIVGLSETLTQ